jgi:D-alanyl-D-alanine carboxypeptidase
MIVMAARVLAAATALAVAVPAAAAASAPHPQPLQSALDQLVAAGAPGAVLLDRHDGRTVRLASGYADTAERRKMRVGDRFRAASQMKSFTATIVLQLVEERRLRLDDPVDRIIPGVIPHHYGDGVTVRHLLQNNSGLFDFNSDPRVLEPYLAGDLGHVWTPQQLLDIAFSHEPLFPPGATFNYSDTNFFLAAYIVEEITGHTFDRELRNRILKPLHLRATDLPTTAAFWGPHAHGYFGEQDLTYMYPWAWAAGGLNTNVDDSATFYRALFGGRLLGPRMMREMEKTIPATGADLPSGSGLGVQRWTPCGVAWGHSGNTPGYLVYTWISPDLRHETVLMINEDPATVGMSAYERFVDLLTRSFCER